MRCFDRTLRQAEDMSDHLLASLSPLGWEHVSLTGDYIRAIESVLEPSDGLRPLRPVPKAVPQCPQCGLVTAKLCRLAI